MWKIVRLSTEILVNVLNVLNFNIVELEDSNVGGSVELPTMELPTFPSF